MDRSCFAVFLQRRLPISAFGTSDHCLRLQSRKGVNIGKGFSATLKRPRRSLVHCSQAPVMPSPEQTLQRPSPFDVEDSPNGYLYFCYGSNLSREKLRNRAIQDNSIIHFDQVWVGRLKDWRLCFNLRAVPPFDPCMGSIRQDEGNEVYGLVYRITDKESWFKLLRSEGVTEKHERDGYQVVDVDVECYDAKTPNEKMMKRATTLCTNKKYAIGRDIEPYIHPSQRYMDILISGAHAEGLPSAYVEKLRAHKVARKWSNSPLLFVMRFAIPMIFMMRKWGLIFIATRLSKAGLRLYAWHERMLSERSARPSIKASIALYSIRMMLFTLNFSICVPTILLYAFSPRLRASIRFARKVLASKQPVKASSSLDTEESKSSSEEKPADEKVEDENKAENQSHSAKITTES